MRPAVTHPDAQIVEYNSSSSLHEQLLQMRETGVYVSVHTSNLANAPLLQPGSAVVEVIQVGAVRPRVGAVRSQPASWSRSVGGPACSGPQPPRCGRPAQAGRQPPFLPCCGRRGQRGGTPNGEGLRAG